MNSAATSLKASPERKPRQLPCKRWEFFPTTSFCWTRVITTQFKEFVTSWEVMTPSSSVTSLTLKSMRTTPSASAMCTCRASRRYAEAWSQNLTAPRANSKFWRRSRAFLNWRGRRLPADPNVWSSWDHPAPALKSKPLKSHRNTNLCMFRSLRCSRTLSDVKVILNSLKIWQLVSKRTNPVSSIQICYIKNNLCVVPDDIIIDLVRDRLERPDCRTNGWILEGCPMNQN